MNSSVTATLETAAQSVLLEARPEAIRIVPSQTGLIVVDLQNGYASEGGYRSILGQDVSNSKAVIANSARLIECARTAGVSIVFLKNGWDRDLKTAGGEASPNWHKSNPLKLMRNRPELSGRILTHDTWDYEFVDEMKPGPDDIVVPKARYSGFCGTALDSILRARNIRTLLFVGIATNVCVESTIREAYHREFFCVLVSDATTQSGPAFIQEATVYNVERFLGWVTTTSDICAALSGAPSDGSTA
jgi:ureidoacrylate peracid hydrolase